MGEQEQPFARYLRQLRAQLGPLTAEQRATIEAELWAHLEDVAAARGSDPADAATQNSVIHTLGSSRRLGHGLAQSYRKRGEDSMYTAGWRFWLLWVLASVAVWMLAAPMDDDTLLRLAVGGAVVTLVHVAIVQRFVALAGWWRWGVLGFCGPWLATAVLYAMLPWETWPEGRVERTMFWSLVALGIVSGIAQWWVLRRYLVAGLVWLVVPFMTLLVSIIGMGALNSVLIPLGMDRRLNMIGGWSGIAVIVNVVFGLYYGVISGTALLLLSRRRAVSRLA